MDHTKFSTAINCMDGRVQVPIIEWLKNEYGVLYIDMITEPGPNKILAERKDHFTIELLKKKLEISVNKHRSKLVAVVGHYDCAGNPVEKEIQIKQTLAAIETVRSWGFGIEIIGLWVNENWEVSRVR